MRGLRGTRGMRGMADAGGGVYVASTYNIARAATYLDTPTYCFGAVGVDEALHPSVVYRAAGWNGKKYWMAMTPYPDLDATWENPSILCSADGTTWTVPAGLTNPLDEVGGPDHNADPELFWDATYTKLYCFWNYWDNPNYTVFRMESTDGATWTNKQAALTGAGYIFVTPAILHDGTNYRMYVVDITTNPNGLKYRTCSTLDGTWSAPVTCTVNGIPALRDMWHMSVYKNLAGAYTMLLTTCTVNVSGVAGRLGVATSADGITWTFQGETLLPSVAGWDNSNIYRASAVQTGALTWDVWYSAYSTGVSPNQAPHIARTTMTVT